MQKFRNVTESRQCQPMKNSPFGVRLSVIAEVISVFKVNSFKQEVYLNDLRILGCRVAVQFLYNHTLNIESNFSESIGLVR